MAWITKLQAGKVLALPVWLAKQEVKAFWTSSTYLASWKIPLLQYFACSDYSFYRLAVLRSAFLQHRFLAISANFLSYFHPGPFTQVRYCQDSFQLYILSVFLYAFYRVIFILCVLSHPQLSVLYNNLRKWKVWSYSWNEWLVTVDKSIFFYFGTSFTINSAIT